MFEPNVTVKEIFKTIVQRTHLQNTGMYYLYMLIGPVGTYQTNQNGIKC